MITRHQKATKRFDCDYCGNNSCGGIKPGQRYFIEIITPWDMIVEDVDDDGRPIRSRSGEWFMMRFSVGCYNDYKIGE